MIVTRSPGLIRRERPGLIRSVGALRFGHVLDRPRRAAAGLTTLYDVILKAGLTTGLQICLDAGDKLSYDPAQADPQVWRDRSGNGFDFHRGLTGSAAGDDPTFNGKAGDLSNKTYWSSDGGDAFDYDAANEAWMNNLHLDNAVMSVLACAYPAAASENVIFGTIYTAPGVHLRVDSAGKLAFRQNNAATSFNKTADNAMSATAWNVVGMTLDEAGGANASFFYRDGAYDPAGGLNTWDGAYNTPGGTSGHFAIMAEGSDDTTTYSLVSPNGMRLKFFALWTVALTKANFDALFAALRGRQGI
jgi:hypothetical protein